MEMEHGGGGRMTETWWLQAGMGEANGRKVLVAGGRGDMAMAVASDDLILVLVGFFSIMLILVVVAL
jgi:hypothetical protein